MNQPAATLNNSKPVQQFSMDNILSIKSKQTDEKTTMTKNTQQQRNTFRVLGRGMFQHGWAFFRIFTLE